MFGDDQAETFEAISSLAGTYWLRGKYDEAERLELEVVEGQKWMFGDDHAKVVEAIPCLPSTY